jgi:hypothetical protein
VDQQRERDSPLDRELAAVTRLTRTRTLRASANARSTGHRIAYRDTIWAGPAAHLPSVVTSARS